MSTFGNFFAPVLVPAHTVNNLDLGDEKGLQNEGYQSEKLLFCDWIQKHF